MRAGVDAPSVRLRFPALLAALLLLLPAAAAAAVDPRRLGALLEDGRADEAWALARVHRATHEGEPRFDFYYGVAAIETGNLGEAVFALRRVVAVSPGFARARAELGRAWFLLGEDLRARAELERALAGGPPAPLRARIERLLYILDRRAARYRTTVSGYLEIGGGHDSNVNSATDAESIDTVVGPGFLVEDAREQADAFARAAGGLRVSRPLVADLNVFAELDGERRYHDDETGFEVGAAQARGGVVLRGESTRTTLAARGARVYLGGEPFRDVRGVDAGFRYAASEVRVAEVAAAYSRLRHDTLGIRDSDLWQLAGGITRRFRAALQPTLALAAFYGEERAERDTQDARAVAERELHGAGTELHLQLGTRWVVRTGVHYRRSEYAAVDDRFGEAREEDYYAARVVLEWRPALNWRVQQRLGHETNDSNLELYEFDRSIVELRVRYEFE